MPPTTLSFRAKRGIYEYVFLNLVQRKAPNTNVIPPTTLSFQAKRGIYEFLEKIRFLASLGMTEYEVE